jgi:MFS family permease
MELLVLGYLILGLTNSPFQVGLIAVFLNLPRPILALFAGLLADRVDRRRILIGTHAIYFGLATTIMLLLFSGTIQPWHVFVLVFIQGATRVTDDPARRTAIFDLAGQEYLTSAMSLETITNNWGRILGPLAGGMLIAWAGFTGAYVVIVAIDLAALLLITRMRLPFQAQAISSGLSMARGLWEGLEHSVSNRMVLGVLSMSLIVNALVFPIQYFIPVIASDLLLVGPVLGGLLGSAEGIGALIGASTISLKREFRYHGRLFCAGAITVASAVALMAWSPWFAVSFSLLLLGGFGQAGFSTMQSTILLLETQPEMRGRVMGAQGAVNGLGHLIGGSEIGAIASVLGIGLAIGVNAGAGLLLIIAVVVLTPLVRQPVGIARGKTTDTKEPRQIRNDDERG